MLKQNDAVRKLLNVDVWHNAGYTGKGVTIVVLDGAKGKPRKGMESYYTDVFGKATESGHGTNVAQVIHEFAPDAKILYFDDTRNKDAVFDWIKSHKDEIDLINVSMAGIGGMTTDDYLRYEALNIPMFCASGNDYYDDHISYPARYPFTIAIGATNRAGNDVDSYSNGGPMLNAVCPSHIYITNSDGEIWAPSGTSFADPTAVGITALYVDWRKVNKLPKLTSPDAMKFVDSNCKDIEDEGFDYESGHGLYCLAKTIPIAPKEVPMSTPYNRTIQAIVIHHMGDGKPPEESILGRWNPYNYDYPEYDYGIEADGTIRIGRPLTIQGSHTISDKAPYSQKGYQWWNRNAIGIGLAGDFTKYPMPRAQFDSLVGVVVSLMSAHSLTLDDIYPHGQITYTNCPGCTYSKVPALTKGLWSYDAFEQAVLRPEKEEDESMKVAIAYWTLKDFSAAEQIAAKLGNCGMFCRNANPVLHPDAKAAKHLIVIGGPEVTDHPNVTNKCGFDGPATAILAAQYAQTL